MTVNSNVASFKTESKEARYAYIRSYRSMQPVYNRSGINESRILGFLKVLIPPHMITLTLT